MLESIKKICNGCLLAWLIPSAGFGGLAPEYYDPVSTATPALLRTTLSARLANEHSQIGYDNTWLPLRDTDQATTSVEHVRLIYGGDIRLRSAGTDADKSPTTGGWNREHIFPQSFFNENEPMRSDIHALYPADSDVNTSRSNSPYQVIANPTYTDTLGNKATTSLFEPSDIDKGRVARAVLYMDVRYEGLDGEPNLTVVNTYPGGTGQLEMAFLDTLLSWHRQYPPDALERARNYKAYSYQLNTNPFVDHPEWVDDLYGGPTWSVGSGDVLTVSGVPSSPLPVPAGTVNFPLLVIPTDTSGQEIHIAGLRINQLGTATASDAIGLKLWFDVDRSGDVSPHDSLLSTTAFETTETELQLSHPFYCARGFNQFLITTTIPFSASTGRTLQVSLAEDGIELSDSGGSDLVAPFAPLISQAYVITPPTAAEAGLVISEVFEGSQGNLKYIEIYNSTSQTVSLAEAGVSLRRYTNGNMTPTSIDLGTGTIASGDLYILANNITDFQAAFGFMPDGVSAGIAHNGNDIYDIVDEESGLVIDGFAMDRLGSSVDFAADRVAHRIMHELPNNGVWGAVSGGLPDNSTAPSGYWRVRTVTAGNGNASMVGTPGTLDDQQTRISEWMKLEVPPSSF